MKCKDCDGPVKPNIVFFGESLNPKFKWGLERTITGPCDLMLVIGTGLLVKPFNTVINQAKPDCPRVLINLENTVSGGYDFDTITHPERLFLQGKCDEVLEELCK